jgi:Fe-S cluster biogenesis protein NfuA
MREKIEILIRDILQPLVRADGGEVELVSVDRDSVVLRLGGTCSGCPGRSCTTSEVIEPLVKKVLGPSVSVRYDDIGPLKSR